MKQATTFILGLCLLPAAASAGMAEWGGGAGISGSRDSEHFSVDRYQLYALPSYQNGDHLTGAKLTYHQFSQNGWRENGEQVSLIHRDGHPGDPVHLQLDLGFYRQGDHEILSVDGTYARQIADRTRVEVFGSRDWVETATALQRGIHYSFLGAALEQGLGEHVTLVGVGGGQSFSDGNHRNHARLRVIYQPFLDSGFTLQAHRALFHSSSNDVGGAYFNPENYRRTLFGLGYRQRWNGWVGSISLAAGPQKVDGDGNQRSELAEFIVENPHSVGWSLKMRGGYSRAAGFNGPDYIYRYLLAEWLLPF